MIAKLSVAALGCLAWGFDFSSRAAMTNVNVGDDFFAPVSVTIAVNDKVKWTWVGSLSHSSTSDTSLWDSGIHGIGFTFTNTFNSAGSFPYHCQVHTFQTGSIVVQAASLPPVVLSNPRRLSPTQFRFDYTASTGKQYVVQRSTSFTNFIALATNTASGSSVAFTDTTASASMNYYRVGRLPNP